MRVFLTSLIFLMSVTSSAEQKTNALFTFVLVKTSMGNIHLKLYNKDVPRTVENFVGLVTGKKEFRNIKTGKKVKDTPFYQNMVFHKIHPELGIQTGCPWGNGKGYPGFTIKEELTDKKFDRPFLVGMAKIPDNPGSIGSQFFITTEVSPHLDGKYAVMGEVVSGEEVVRKIANSPHDAMMKPIKPIKLIEVVIE